MIQFGIVAACIILIVGLLHARDNRVVKEERARVSAEASNKNDRAQAARKSVTSTNANSMLERWYRD